VRAGLTVLGPDVRAERHAAHRLQAAGDPDVDGARLDQVVDEVGRLLPGTALRVDRRRTGVVGEPGVLPGAAHRVHRLLARLRDDAADHLLDLVRVEAGP